MAKRRIRVTKVFETDIDDLSGYNDASMGVMPSLHMEWFEEKGITPPTFPIDNPFDAMIFDRHDHEVGGYNLTEMSYELKDTKWEVINEIGLPVKDTRSS